jgi:glycosyltransferase involved in cell wall biosynthesis
VPEYYRRAVRARPVVVHLQKIGGISGSEKYLLGLLPRLRALGWDVRMLVLHEHPRHSAEFRRQLTADGVPVSALRLRAHADPVAFGALAALLARLRPQVVHTHLVHGDFYGLAAAFAARVPLRVSTKHGFDDFRGRRSFAYADRLVARLAHRHVAVSAGLADYLDDVEGFRASHFDVIHYGIDAREEAPPAADPARLLVLGRLIPIKGHSILLRAFAAARAEVGEVKLDVVGAGAEEPALRALAQQLGLGGSVRFVGGTTDIDPWIEGAAVVVVPSLGEGFGRVAIEAMERGRPVIASDVGGLAEVVAHRATGVLVPPGEEHALKEAIVELVRDPAVARRMGDAGRARVVAGFSETRCAEQTDALYREALAARGVEGPSKL